ncbi:hypothetical protein [Ornithinimicrobium cerasi]|uniref:DUF4386 family protein n=1 Tax=Ornithinimicrobium cerasi TaxID=2248773 RepID=A0A285VI48_9MICO|nr:hypothetical protein [Ornithinimicrobium cerasi]SOC53557.1 hypothetical protein SAMN05421879_10221 [Ornithinimicrobium cerasi]
MHHLPSTLEDGPLRRCAGVAALLFVAASVVSMLVSGPPVVHVGQEGLEHSLSGRGLAAALTGLAVVTAGLVVLLLAVTYLAQSLGRRSAVGALAAQTGWGAGLGYVVVLVGAAFPAGAAAAWASDGGMALETVLLVNNVRNFAYLAVLPLMGVTALGLGVAALTDRSLTRWTGWGGVTVGVLSLLALPAAAVGITYAMPLWLLWWAGVGVTLLRRPAPATVSTLPSEVGVRHT